MNWIFFDCDSTLSAIEGIDELARMRGVFAEIAALTDRAMNGEIALDAIFAARLETIRPTRAECEEVGRMYIEQIEPTARETVTALRAAGWNVAILSGGYVQPIRPLADLLGIERVEAVELKFAPDGGYAGYDEDYPTTRNGGKPLVIERLRKELGITRAVMVGDGISDLETKGVVDQFIAYAGYTSREKVRSQANACVTSLRELLPLLIR